MTSQSGKIDYVIIVLFTNTSFEQKFINYLGPIISNSLSIDMKKKYFYNKMNIKNYINDV